MTSMQLAARKSLAEIQKVRERVSIQKHFSNRQPVKAGYLDELESIYNLLIEEKDSEAAAKLATSKNRNNLVYLIPKEIYNFLKTKKVKVT